MSKLRQLEDRLSSLVPPGTDVTVELRAYCITLGACLLLSLQTLGSIFDTAREMQRYSTSDPALPVPTDVMPPFSAFCGMLPFILFVMTALCVIGMAAHRLALTRESNALYLMRRLPTRGELFRRVYLLPLWGIGMAVAVFGVFYCIYFLFYIKMPNVGYPRLF